MNDYTGVISSIVLIGILSVIALPFFRNMFFTVGEQQEGLVSRFGKYLGKPRKPGLQVKIPWIDKVDQIVSTALQQVSANLDTKTTDDQFVTLPISIQFSVKDTARYFYDTTNPNHQIKDIVTAEVRKYTSRKNFQELYDDRQEISEAVITSVTSELEDYGVTVARIVIDEPQPDANTKEAYNDVRASERRKDAAKNDAEAEYIKIVKAAEADQKRNELIGQGVKSFRMSIAQSYIETREILVNVGVDEKSADAFMTESMRLDTMRDVGEKGNLVVMALDKTGIDNNVMPQVMAGLKATQATSPHKRQYALPSTTQESKEVIGVSGPG